MAGNDKTLETLQKLVDGFTMDIGRVRAALADDQTKDAAKKLLVGGLNYVLDSWDMFPDHYPGVGVVDDALVLRVSAHLATQEGATHRGLQQLAGEMKTVRLLLEDLVDPLKQLCATLGERKVRGRTPTQILTDPDTRAVFEADLNRLAKRQSATVIDAGTAGAESLVRELRKMVKSALAKAGFAS